MPVLPVCLLEPIWAPFAVVRPGHPAVAPARPLGCRQKRIPDRAVFDHVVAALAHGSGDERIATPGCSDRTIRRRVRAWAGAGAAEQLHALVLAQTDRLIGLDLDDRHDAPLPAPALAGLDALGPPPDDAAVHPDRGYDGAPTRRLLDGRGVAAVIARRGVPAPRQVGGRWVVERARARMNGFGKLRRCTERSGTVADFSLVRTAAAVTTRHLFDEARTRLRWDNRPTTRRLS